MKRKISLLLFICTCLLIWSQVNAQEGRPTAVATNARGDRATATATPTETAQPTETSTPTATSTATPTSTSMAGDAYEIDSYGQPAIYTGKMFRSFSPNQDIDYVLYHVKVGQVEIQTLNLAGEADTFVEVFDYQTGNLLARDDDGGYGLASRINLYVDRELDILVVITNKALGYGESVLYDLEITQEADFTPTPTPLPTQTPMPQPTTRPTQTPLPTYTPYPTPISPPPAPPLPRATATPSTLFHLRIEVFTDADMDGILDIGEGVENVFVDVNSLDRAAEHLQGGYTQNGILILEITCPPGADIATALEISVPYLQETQILEGADSLDETAVVQFILNAPLLPIRMP